MAVKTFEVKFSDLAKEYSSRFDCDFLDFSIKEKQKNDYSFNDLFDFIQREKVDIENLKTFNYAEIGNVEKTGDVGFVSLNFNNRNELNENYFSKIEKGDILKPELNDILISSVRPNLKKFVFVNKEESDSYFTKAFIHLRPKGINSRVIYYALRSVFLKNLISISRQGKGYPTLKNVDLKYLYFDKDVIEKLKSTQDQAVAKIKPIEDKIKKLKSQIKEPADIINKVFTREFKFDLEEFKKLKKEKNFKISLSKFSNNKDLRCSFKFHNKAGKFVLDFLKSITNKRIKDFLAESIILGAGISPKFYDENGDYYYISMADIKKWYFDEGNAKCVSAQYAEKNNAKEIQKNDIILARSGEGTVGKVALIKKEIKGIFCDFTMRIKLKDYNELFAYYYFRTDFFQYLIEVNKKGLGNNTNIFPSQIQEFPLLDVSLSQQQKIVNEIKTKLNKQEKIRKKIGKEREKIDEIINQCIK